MKAIFDLSSLVWTCLLVGVDKESYTVKQEDGTEAKVNTAAYGYENAISSIVSTLRTLELTPIDCIFVEEGFNSKARRLMISQEYKAKRGQRSREAYKEFADCKTLIEKAMRGVGAIFVKQDNVEADDVIAWLAINSHEPVTIVSNDNDLLALAGTSKHGAKINTCIGGVFNTNKYGYFEAKHITVYKAMVGDSSDSIPGIKGFGPKAFEKFHVEFRDAGLDEMLRLGELGSLDELALEAEQHPMIGKIYEHRDAFLTSYKLARMYPEWVNTLADPLQWRPGFVSESKDERLKAFSAQTRVVTETNWPQALAFFSSMVGVTPFFAIDVETTVPDESDDWQAANGEQVDVIASTLTSFQISFGPNCQYAYLLSINHIDSDNLQNWQEKLQQLISLIPKEKLTIAHNAAGFELPVVYNAVKLGDNGWRGMLPNMVDTRIAASYWDENQFSHGLKQLSKLLFDYEQTTYAEVTGGKKMHELTAQHILHYGCDDVYTAGGLWNFFKLFMQYDNTFTAFMEYEQKPMYLQALAYTQGITLDMPKLAELTRKDEQLLADRAQEIDTFLIGVGWEGSVTPVYTELTPAVVKEAVLIVLGQELKTQVRKLDKLAEAVEALEVDGAKILAGLVREQDIAGINKLVSMHFQAKPTLNTGSPKQMQKLLYETLGLPIRLRNPVTDAAKAKGATEGSPKTDDDAMNMAVKFGDVEGDAAKVLKSLIEVKSAHTRRGLYWEPYPKLLHWKTGKLHPNLRQSATNTRRFAGSSPNIQQLDSSRGGVRCVIMPHHKNAVIASLDESAQEVRQLADYCQDANLLTCYLGTKEQLRDVHSIVACRIAGCDYAEFRRRLKSEDKSEADEAAAIRQKAKITLFASIYGAGPAKIGQGLGISKEEAQTYLDTIYEQFPEVKAWKEASETMARTVGYVPIHGGTVRHLQPLINSDNQDIAAKALRQAGNARIQSAGGNQIKRVMCRIWDSRLIEDYDYRWYFSVHDETVHSFHKDHAVPVLRQLHSFMTEQFLTIVPSASSIGLGPNFGDLNELGESYSEDKIQDAVNQLFNKEANV